MRTMILALVLLLTSNLAVAVEPGVYYCVTERMVGIQPEREAKEDENTLSIPRYAGRIATDAEKFIVKIQSIDETYRMALCAGAIAQADILVASAIYCSPSMKWEAILPQNKKSFYTMDYPLVGLRQDRGLFTAGLTTFWLYATLDFHLVRIGAGFGNYVEEGYCETFEE